MVIGILGGMGTYATIYLFQQYAEIFKAEKEWDRPRIIIDNRCTMPSRVKAYLYGEKTDELIEEMSDSLLHLMNMGCDRIILACNTSHLFLPSIYQKIPSLKGKILDIVENCINELKKEKIGFANVIATEATIESSLFQEYLCENSIEYAVPSQNEYICVRKCIEAVKQNKYSAEVREIFLDLVSQHEMNILGCTELPILCEKYKEECKEIRFIDPLVLAVKELKREFDNDKSINNWSF